MDAEKEYQDYMKKYGNQPTSEVKPEPKKDQGNNTGFRGIQGFNGFDNFNPN